MSPRIVANRNSGSRRQISLDQKRALEKRHSPMQTAHDSAMKRTTSIVCCVLILLAAAAAAWADCAQISFAPSGHDHGRSAPAHTHGHHSDSEHQHSHDSAIHCPTIDEFVPTAAFSVSSDPRMERVPLADPLDPHFTLSRFPSLYGPPGRFPLSSRVPHYLSLSVLRI
jgi:hypothetical protein